MKAQCINLVLFLLSFRNICSGGYSVIFTHSIGTTVEYGETVDGVVLEKDIQLFMGPPIIRKSILAENSI